MVTGVTYLFYKLPSFAGFVDRLERKSGSSCMN
jgi:hypothetical protein